MELLIPCEFPRKNFQMEGQSIKQTNMAPLGWKVVGELGSLSLWPLSAVAVVSDVLSQNPTLSCNSSKNIIFYH